MLKPREDGVIEYSDRESDRTVQVRTIFCRHCNRHMAAGKALEIAAKGEMGFCFKCDGPVCPGCTGTCRPLEQWMENLELGRDPGYVPIVSQPGTLPVDPAKLTAKLILPE